AIEQHQQWAFEEAELVKNDKSNGDAKTGGLFKGIFRPRRARLLPNHDPVDHVDRCPRCNWEIEDGMCLQCGIHMDSWSDDSDISTTDLSNSLHAESIEDDFEEDDMDADPEFGEFDANFDPEYDFEFDPQAYDAWLEETGILDYSDHPPLRSAGAAGRAGMLRQMVRERGRTNVRNTFHRAMREGRLMDAEAEDDLMGYDHDEEDEDEDDEDEEAGSIDDFLDDRDINDITAYTISSQTAELTPARQRRNHHHHSHNHSEAENSNSDSDSDSDSDGVRHNPHFRRPQVPVYTIPSDDEEPVAPSNRRRPIRVIDSDESSGSSESDSEDEDDEVPRPPSTRTHLPASRRSNPPLLVNRRQARPIRILDSEDDNEEEVSNSSSSSDEESLHDAEDEDEEVHYNNYSDDIEAAQGGAEEAGFSPMQENSASEDEDEGDQNAVNYFNVYGDEGEGEGSSEDDEEEEEDDY
ncbi:hypothetical protein KCU97_g11752, partial [Aureobasidium melanogenum]